MMATAFTMNNFFSIVALSMFLLVMIKQLGRVKENSFTSTASPRKIFNTMAPSMIPDLLQGFLSMRAFVFLFKRTAIHIFKKHNKKPILKLWHSRIFRYQTQKYKIQSACPLALNQLA